MARSKKVGARALSAGDHEPFRSPQEVADYLGVPLHTVYSWQARGTGPKFYKVGKHVRYRMSDVDAWMNMRASA